MKLRPLLEVRYAGSLEAEQVLYTLWKERNKIQKDNLSVVKIDDPALSEKRAAAIARYTVRVIVPETLDVVGLTDEAQKLRDLPPDVGLDRAHDAAYAAATAVRTDAVFAADAYNTAYNAARGANYAKKASGQSTRNQIFAADYARAVFYADLAAYFTSQVTRNKHRHLYHLDQMMKLAADIK